jgi:hypothetical protein
MAKAVLKSFPADLLTFSSVVFTRSLGFVILGFIIGKPAISYFFEKS